MNLEPSVGRGVKPATAWPLQAHENELSKLLELVESLQFLILITNFAI